MIDTKEYSGRNDLSSLDVHKLIILVGAGVSIAPPTKLPSGKALTEYYLESCIGKELTNEILQRWKKLNDIIYKSNGFQNSLIRLEFIIGCINEIDIEFRYVPFIAGFQQFVNVNSNINHIYLGELLKRGCKIITPNFDCSIEKVFNSFCTTVRLGIPANDVKGGTIYHYHGIGTQYKQLGATISEIKKGLRKEFGNQLKEWFKQGYSIVSVGFSCSDYFDMTPFFESLAEDTYAGTAIFFQHGNVVEKEVENKIAKFYRGFKDRKIIYGDTSTFLSDLCKYFGGSDCVCKINIEEDWKVEFERIIKTEKRENLFYLIKLLNQSGINLSKDVFEYPNKPDLIRKFNDMNELLEYAMEQLKGIDVKTYADNLEDRSKSIFSDIIDMCRRNNYASDNFRRIESAYRIVTQSSGVRKEAKQIQYNELVEHIKKSELVPENFITVYVYAFNRIAKEQIKNIFSQNVITTRDAKIIELYECAVKMLQLPFHEYEYKSYYISISKIYNVLCIMLEKENDIDKEENFLINIALEICGLSLVVKIYFNTILQYIMLFIVKREWLYFEKAKEKMSIVKECIETAENYELMLVWEEKRRIMQAIEKEFRCYGRFSYNELMKLII